MPIDTGQIEQLTAAFQSSVVGAALLILFVVAIGTIFGIRFISQLVKSYDNNAQSDGRTADVMRDLLMTMVASQQKADDRYAAALERTNALNEQTADGIKQQTSLLKQQLEQLVVIGKNQANWHTVIDTDINTFRETVLMLSNRIGGLEDMLTTIQRYIETTPDSDEKSDVIIAMLQTIASRLDHLNSKFDTQEIEAVKPDGDVIDEAA